MADEGKDPSEQKSGLRTGGNMQTKGSERVPATSPSGDVGTRTGGNMQTRSAGGAVAGGQTTDQPAEDAGDTPAGQSQ